MFHVYSIWINTKLARHYPCFHFWFIITYHPKHHQGKPNVLSRGSYFVPKEVGKTYDQQFDVILKPNYLWLQALCVILSGKSFLVFVCEKLLEDIFANGNEDNWKIQIQL